MTLNRKYLFTRPKTKSNEFLLNLVEIKNYLIRKKIAKVNKKIFLRKIGSEYINSTYEVVVNEDETKSIIAQFLNPSFRIEKYRRMVDIIDIIKRKGIPCPEVLLVDFSLNDFDRPLVITNKLKGSEIGNELLLLMKRNELEKMESLLRDFFRVLEIIHNVERTKVFGVEINQKERKKEKYKSFFEFSCGVGITYGKRLSFKHNVGKIINHLKDLGSELNTSKFCFCHNDYTTDNVISFNNKISGVLDWGEVIFSDELDDLSLTLFDIARLIYINQIGTSYQAKLWRIIFNILDLNNEKIRSIQTYLLSKSLTFGWIYYEMKKRNLLDFCLKFGTKLSEVQLDTTNFSSILAERY